MSNVDADTDTDTNPRRNTYAYSNRHGDAYTNAAGDSYGMHPQVPKLRSTADRFLQWRGAVNWD